VFILSHRLYSQLVSDALEEFSYNADLAGLSYNLTNQSTGIYLALSGYNDKISILAQHVLDKAKNLVVNSERLEVYKEQVRDCQLQLPGSQVATEPQGLAKLLPWESLLSI